MNQPNTPIGRHADRGSAPPKRFATPVFSAEVDAEYHLYRYRQLLRLTPLIGVAGLIIFAVFILLDVVYLPASVSDQTLSIRLFVNCPLVVLCLFAAFRQWPLKVLEACILMAYIAAGLGVVMVVHVAHVEQVYLPHDGFLLLLVFGYFLLNIRAASIGLASVFVSGVYLYTYTKMGRPEVEFYLTAFFLVAFNAMGIFGSLLQDRRQRNLFWNKKLVEDRQAKDQAEIQSKTRLVATASHDLRQPLHAMNLMIELLEEKLASKPEQKLATKLKGALAQLNRLLASLLSISQINMGSVEVKNQSLNMADFLEEIVSEETARAELQGLHLALACDSDIQVNTDMMLLSRIVRNVIHNVMDHADASLLDIRVERASGQAVLTLKDNGCGIDPDQVDALFEEFQQGDSQIKTGMGLGLSIIKRLSEILDLDMGFSSELGKGCAFQFKLMLVDDQEIKKDAKKVIKRTHFDASIVLLEDDAVILSSMESLLSDWGVSVIAGDRVDAIAQRIAANPPKLIISDYHLSENRTGVAEIRALREMLSYDLPAILLTADTALDNHWLAESEPDLEQVIVLHKPIQPAKIRLAIQSVIAKH